MRIDNIRIVKQGVPAPNKLLRDNSPMAGDVVTLFTSGKVNRRWKGVRWQRRAIIRCYQHLPNGRWKGPVDLTPEFTIDLWQHPDVLYYAGANYGSITVLDDYTFKAIFTNPSESLLDGWDVFYPKHLLENLDPKEFTSWKFWTEPVGNGPYRYVRHVPRTMIEFEANPDHYKGKPKIERLVLKFGGYPLIELLSGNVDCIYINSLEAIKLADDPRFRVYQGGSGTRRNQIFWNQRNPLFGNVTVRRALTLAINRPELHRVLNFSDDFFITDGIYTNFQARFGEIPEPLPYDPEQAKRLLEEAGWHDRNANRIRDKDGREFHFTMIAEDGIHKQAAVYIHDQLRHLVLPVFVLGIASAASTARYMRNRLLEVLSEEYILAACMISAVLVVLGNLFADITYAIVDPRVSYEK